MARNDRNKRRRGEPCTACCFRCCLRSRCASRWRTRCGRRCRPRHRRLPASMPGTPRSTASSSTMRRSAMVRRWCCCTVASPIPTIGGIRSLHSRRDTPVILVDSRGHGRSTRDARPYGYDLMADDVVALLDTLHIAKADVVGWSDGAILGIDLAIRHPDRVGRIFAFAANTVTSGVQDGVERTQPSHGTSRAPAANMRGCRRRRGTTTRSSRRSARCGRPSRTGPTRN